MILQVASGILACSSFELLHIAGINRLLKFKFREHPNQFNCSDIKACLYRCEEPLSTPCIGFQPVMIVSLNLGFKRDSLGLEGIMSSIAFSKEFKLRG